MGEYSRTYKRIAELENSVKEDAAMLDIIIATRKLLEIAQKKLADKLTDFGTTVYYKGKEYKTVKEYDILTELLDSDNNDYSEDKYNNECAIGECNGYLSELRSLDGE